MEAIEAEAKVLLTQLKESIRGMDKADLEVLWLKTQATYYQRCMDSGLFKKTTPEGHYKVLGTKNGMVAKTRAGIVTIFQNATVYGDPLGAIAYWAHRRGRRKSFGPFMGFIIAEIPASNPYGRIMFEFTRDDPKVVKRRATKAALRKKRIKIGYYNKYLKKNTLDKFTKKRRK